MELTKNLMIGFSEGDFGPAEWARLGGVARQTVVVPKGDASIASHLRDAEAVMLRLGASFDAEAMSQSPNLRYLGMYGTGYGRIDVRAAKAKQIVVTNLPNYSTQGVAELCIASLIAYLREIPRALLQAKKGDFSESSFTGTELAGKTVGILGLGNIGSRVARIAADGFGCNVIYWSPHRKPEVERENLVYHEPDEVIERSDFLSLHMAFVPETAGFLDAKRVGKLRKGCVLLNFSPMELMDTPALEQRVASKEISLILDHSDEIPNSEALRLSGYPNCMVLPPIGYTTQESSARKREIFLRNAEAFIEGTPQNDVTQGLS